MRLLICFFIVLIFVLYSCGWQNSEVSQKPKISMVGKWHRFSIQNGYSEFEIDSQYVVVVSQKFGKSRLAYKIDNDSFKYLTIDYSAQISAEGDSMIVLKNGNEVATLIRYDKSVCPFENIPDEHDTLLYNAYMENFYKRAEQAWTDAGFSKN